MWLKAWQAIRNTLSNLRKGLEGAVSALRTNLRVCESQWALYKTEVNTVIKPGIQSAPWHRRPHKVSAFGEEFYDKCPRIAHYMDIARIPLEVVGLVVVLKWVF